MSRCLSSWAGGAVAAIFLVARDAASSITTSRCVTLYSATAAGSSTERSSAAPVAVDGLHKAARGGVIVGGSRSRRGKCDGHEGSDNGEKLHRV
jgi:hypothetical protein